MSKRVHLIMVALIAATLAAGCSTPTPTAVPAKPTAPAVAPTQDQLMNLEYQTDITASKKAKLVAGQFEEAAAPGSASKITVRLLATPMGFGDLNGDGADDAAVILAASGGGSGTFISLHAVVKDQTGVKDVAWVALGDRVQVKAVQISTKVITINMIKHGPNDPLCCPTQEATVKYQLQDGKLNLIP